MRVFDWIFLIGILVVAFLALIWLRAVKRHIKKASEEGIPVCPDCLERCHKVAYHSPGEGWGLHWDCKCGYFAGSFQADIEWPYGDRCISAKMLEEDGYKIV